jgi:hypothetical protein
MLVRSSRRDQLLSCRLTARCTRRVHSWCTAGAQLAQKKCVTVDVTLSLDTGIYAANEVLADTQVISNVFRANDVGGELESVTVIDIDYQTAANDAMTLCVGNLWRLLKPVTGTRNLAMAVTTGGAPTHTSQASCSGVVGGVVRPVYFV